MPLRTLALAPLAALAFAALAGQKEPAQCRGKITGAISGSFTCLADVWTTEAGTPVFVITPKDPLKDIPVYKPGAFELPEAPAVRTYTLDDLGMGMASLAIDGGALYTATKTSSQRGEVTLALRSVKPVPGRAGVWIVHGTYRARLVPAGAGKTGEVVFEVSF
jgi:hypothetical protein